MDMAEAVFVKPCSGRRKGWGRKEGEGGWGWGGGLREERNYSTRFVSLSSLHTSLYFDPKWVCAPKRKGWLIGGYQLEGTAWCGCFEMKKTNTSYMRRGEVEREGEKERLECAGRRGWQYGNARSARPSLIPLRREARSSGSWVVGTVVYGMAVEFENGEVNCRNGF
jgi:hypothetical protein